MGGGGGGLPRQIRHGRRGTGERDELSRPQLGPRRNNRCMVYKN
jgi:hypothetical protein